MKYKATILKVKYRFFASCGVMDVTQKEMVEVKQKLLEAAKILQALVPTPKLLENTGE
jgi:hypothetical protein